MLAYVPVLEDENTFFRGGNKGMKEREGRKAEKAKTT